MFTSQKNVKFDFFVFPTPRAPICPMVLMYFEYTSTLSNLTHIGRAVYLHWRRAFFGTNRVTGKICRNFLMVLMKNSKVSQISTSLMLEIKQLTSNLLCGIRGNILLPLCGETDQRQRLSILRFWTAGRCQPSRNSGNYTNFARQLET